MPQPHCLLFFVGCVSARRLKRLPVFYALFCLTSIRKMTCAEGSTNNKSGRIHGNHIAWFEVPAGGGWQRVWDLKFWREKMGGIWAPICKLKADHGRHMPTWPFRSSPLRFPHQFHDTGSFSLLSICTYHHHHHHHHHQIIIV